VNLDDENPRHGAGNSMLDHRRSRDEGVSKASALDKIDDASGRQNEIEMALRQDNSPGARIELLEQGTGLPYCFA
jgi:hypothetical protein